MTPPGFVRRDLPSGVVWHRPGAAPWIEAALSARATLFGAAEADPARLRLEGRGPAFAVPAPAEGGGHWLVRHYRRGGAVAGLLGDRYLRLGRPRPVREMEVSEEARRRGVPTPRVIAAAVYEGGPFYRGDLVTEFVPDSRDLAGILFDLQGGDREATEPALEETGSLIRRMAAAGVRHADLNAKNILIQRTEEGVRGQVLDLDRCTVRRPPGPVSPRGMRDRLERSLRKWEESSGRPLPPGTWTALDRGVRGAG